MNRSALSRLMEVSRQSWGLALYPYSPEHFAFCAEFATFVARRYLSGETSFQIAADAMNELYAYSYVDEDRGLPELAMEIFTAFDEGEYHHSGDPAGIDPVHKYTRPMLAVALQRNSDAHR